MRLEQRDARARGGGEVGGAFGGGGVAEAAADGELGVLRPVMAKDFQRALDKLSASVSERGKEISRVMEWNELYGEMKKKKKRAPMSIYL